MTPGEAIAAVLRRGPVVGWLDLARQTGFCRSACQHAVAMMADRVDVLPTRPVVIALRTGAGGSPPPPSGRRSRWTPPPRSVRELLAERPRTIRELCAETGYSDRHVRYLLAICAEVAIPARRCAPRRSSTPAVYRLRRGA